MFALLIKGKLIITSIIGFSIIKVNKQGRVFAIHEHRFGFLFRFIQRIKDLFTHIDSIKWGHGDKDMALGHQGLEVTNEQGAQQCGNVIAVGVSIGEDADFAERLSNSGLIKREESIDLVIYNYYFVRNKNY